MTILKNNRLSVFREKDRTWKRYILGEHLAEKFAAMNLSAAAFSRQIAVPTNRVTQILNGV